jgi:K+-transporting ATPase KdpF subunit
MVIMIEYIIVGIVSLLVGIYLFAALLRPDWF